MYEGPNIFVVEIGLVPDDSRRNRIGFSGGQEAIDETERGSWKDRSRNDQRAVEIGRDDLNLSG